MSLTDLEYQLQRLLDWVATDLFPAVLSAEGLTYVMLMGVPVLIALLYLRLKR